MRTKIFSAVILMVASLNANAGGAVTAVAGGATLPEQLIQSGMMNNQLGKQAQMVIQQATMIQKQIEQKNELLLLNKTLNPAVLNNVFNQNKQDINSLQTYIGGLVTLSDESSQLREAAVSRSLDINNSGLSYEEYAQRERELVASGDRRRAQLAAHEMSLLKNVNNDVQFVQEMQTKIPTTVGAHGSTVLLNTQMNRMVAQNATMIQLMAANKHDELQTFDEKKRSEKDKENKKNDENAIIKRFTASQMIPKKTISPNNTNSAGTGQITPSLQKVLNP